jgi:hypothetical protein
MHIPLKRVLCAFIACLNTSNPTIKNGGFIMVSKKAIYNLIPQKYYPMSLLKRDGIRKLRQLSKSFYSVPFFAKPDIGLQGLQKN